MFVVFAERVHYGSFLLRNCIRSVLFKIQDHSSYYVKNLSVAVRPCDVYAPYCTRKSTVEIRRGDLVTRRCECVVFWIPDGQFCLGRWYAAGQIL